jgi:hypothetical protein
VIVSENNTYFRGFKMSVRILSGHRLAIMIDTFTLIIGGPAGAIWTNYKGDN